MTETQRSLSQKLHMLSRFGDTFDHTTALANRKAGLSSGGKAKVDLTWPFMCVSINFTKDALQSLRRGELNKKCNKRKDVLSVICDLHHALFYDFGK
jgi:hypothetical protein